MPGRGAEIRKRYICYFIVQLIGALSNYSIYVASLGVTGASAVGALYALAIGAIAGLSVNFAGARFVVFKLVTSSATESKNVRHNR